MKYSAELERDMKAFYDSLSEKDRRRYAALEAAKLGHGGTDYCPWPQVMQQIQGLCSAYHLLIF